jgi:hypothetical protein
VDRRGRVADRTGRGAQASRGAAAGRGRASGADMRIAANQGKAAPAGRPGPVERGGFPQALDRAGEADLDALLAELVSPGPAELPVRGAEVPLLARAVERIALLVNAGAAPSVTVQLGRSLDVRIDQARAGVEVTIRAVHGLSPLAEAELPRLVAALRARGIRVVRAGVLAPAGRGRRSLTPRRSSATTAADDGSVAKW